MYHRTIGLSLLEAIEGEEGFTTKIREAPTNNKKQRDGILLL